MKEIGEIGQTDDLSHRDCRFGVCAQGGVGNMTKVLEIGRYSVKADTATVHLRCTELSLSLMNRLSYKQKLNSP